MIECYQDAQGHTEAVLTFKREEIIYDLQNYAHMEAHLLDEEAAGHVRHALMDIADEGNVDRINRILDLAFAAFKEKLFSFTKYAIENPVLDNTLSEQKSYGIVLSLPQSFSQTTLNLLEKLIHEYVVCYALADYLTIVYPDKAATWAAKADAVEESIQSTLCNRTARIRRRLSVF